MIDTAFFSEPAIFIPIISLLGLFVGSFLNVVIYRLPKMLEREWQQQAAELRGEVIPDLPAMNLATPRSCCPNCHHQIQAIDNIPVISYLFLRGRCRHCQTTIGKRYPVVEFITAALSGFVAWHFGFSIATVGALLFLWSIMALTFIDFDTQLLPDTITLPLLWLGLLFNINGTFVPLSTAVIGAATGYLILWSIYWLFKLTTGKEGMGYGDFKLLAAIGAWLGWKMLPLTILLSSLVGAIIGIGLIMFAKHGRNTPIPFGPYLAIAGLIALIWGEKLTYTYLGNF